MIWGILSMDIAAMSVVMANHQVRADASLAVMSNVKDMLEQQGQQLVEMLQQTSSSVPHPSLGNIIDVKL